jgi:hypothetical protein
MSDEEFQEYLIHMGYELEETSQWWY